MSLYALMVFATTPYGIQLERNEDQRALKDGEYFPASEAAEATLHFACLLCFLPLLIDFASISEGRRQGEDVIENKLKYI